MLVRRVEHLDFLTFPSINAGAGFLSERALLDQRRYPCRHVVILMPGIVGQTILHGLDNMSHRIEPDHIHGSEGSAGCPAHQRAGDGVGFIEGKAKRRGREQREHANAVGDKVRRVESTDHSLTKRGGQETLQIIGQLGVRGRHRNDFDQRHVAGRIEEMYAAETRA